MILSAYSLMGSYFDIRDAVTGEKLKGVQWVDSGKNEIMMLKPNGDPTSREEYAVDENGRHIRITIRRKIVLIRNTSYIGIALGVVKKVIIIGLHRIERRLS